MPCAKLHKCAQCHRKNSKLGKLCSFGIYAKHCGVPFGWLVGWLVLHTSNALAWLYLLFWLCDLFANSLKPNEPCDLYSLYNYSDGCYDRITASSFYIYFFLKKCCIFSVFFAMRKWMRIPTNIPLSLTLLTTIDRRLWWCCFELEASLYDFCWWFLAWEVSASRAIR